MKKINMANVPISVVSRNILFVLLLIYFVQGVFYPVGSIVSQGVLIMYLFISSNYLYRFFMAGEYNTFSWALTVFLVMNVVYYVLGDSVVNGVHSILVLKKYVFFVLTFYSFYELAKNRLLTTRSLKVFSLLYILICVLQYVLGPSIDDMSALEGGFVNNNSYLFVSLLPIVGLFMKNKKLYLSLYSVLIYFVILGSKRGAIIAFVFGSFSVFYYLLKEAEKKNKFRNVLFTVIVLVLVGYYAYSQYLKNYYLHDRIISALDGNSSGRDIIYYKIYNSWYNSSSVWNMLLGYGFNGSRRLTHMYAHNDWLELLAGQGILGIFVYAFVFYGLIRFFVKSSRLMTGQEKSIYLSICGMWFAQSIYSMGYGGLFNYTYTLTVGYLMGDIYNRKKGYVGCLSKF